MRPSLHIDSIKIHLPAGQQADAERYAQAIPLAVAAALQNQQLPPGQHHLSSLKLHHGPDATPDTVAHSVNQAIARQIHHQDRSS